MRDASERYYRRFPAHRDRMRRLADLAASGRIVLPGGEIVSPSRLRSVGSALGTNDGWQTIWSLLEQEPDSVMISCAVPFGAATRCTSLSRQRPRHAVVRRSGRARGLRRGPVLFTGERIRPEWTETVPTFQPWREVALELAEFPWPRLYADAIHASGARSAGGVYITDVYVPLKFSLETALVQQRRPRPPS